MPAFIPTNYEENPMGYDKLRQLQNATTFWVLGEWLELLDLTPAGLPPGLEVAFDDFKNYVGAELKLEGIAINANLGSDWQDPAVGP
jgi:hypothetical protein